MTILRALFICLLSMPILAADWPQYRGPNHDGISAETNWTSDWPKEGPKKVWAQKVGIGSAPVSIVGGKLYTLGFEGGKDTVACFQCDTGKVDWFHAYEANPFAMMHEGGPAAAPAVDGGLVYIQARGGDLICLDATKGEPKWSVNFQKEFKAESPFFGFTASPLVLGDKVIVQTGAKGASTVAIDKTTGKVLWKTGDDPAAYSSPIPFPAGKTTHVGVLNGSGLVVYDVAKGTETARFPWDTPSPMNSHVNAATPVLTGNRAFVASSYDMGCAMAEFDLAAGKATQVWKNDELSTQYNTALFLDGYLYGFHSYGQNDGGGELRCLDAKTGETKWAQKNPGSGSLICSNGKLIMLSRHGELIVAEASPKGYKELARAQVTGSVCRTEPILCDGRIYVRTSRGELMCFDVSGK